ncbi:MAG: M12 family metallo-peptidase [Planctomycetota bacterium]
MNHSRSHSRAKRRSLFEALEGRRLLAIGPENFSIGEQVSTYRLALATTVEFTESVCDVSPGCDTSSASEATQRSVASDALVQIVDEINEIFEQELAIRFDLIPGNDTLISTGDSNSDGYTDNQAGTLIDENRPEIARRLGSTIDAGGLNEFDIGHVLAVGAGGGLARLGVVGHPEKAAGVTGVSSPVTLDSGTVVPTAVLTAILAHEMGHQFGAEHSFNGVDGSCFARESDSAFEAGSGSSIMGYLGICGSDNLSFFPGDESYFHPISLDQIQRYIRTQIPDLASTVGTGNVLPELQVASTHIIPAQTPFALTAMGTDADPGDTLTYSWDQIDVAPRFRLAHYEPFTTFGSPAQSNTLLNQLDLYPSESTFQNGDQFQITGTRPDGVIVDQSFVYSSSDAMSRLVNEINLAFGSSTTGGATATLDDGFLYVTPNGEFGNYDSFFIEINVVAPQARLQFDFISIGESVPLTGGADAAGPLFRSFAPTTDPTRTFLRLPDLLNNTSTLGEELPTQARELNFRATVRDNHAFNGRTVNGLVSDDVLVQVVDTGTPFQITSPSSATTWQGGNLETITWDVAGTDANGIDASQIELSLSLDGGQTYPVLLGTFPNTGSADIVVPHFDAAQSTARLRARGVGNVFFDLSDAEIAINSSSGAGITIRQTEDHTLVSESVTFANDTYTVELDSIPTGEVTVTATAGGQVELSLTGEAGSFASSIDVALSNTNSQTIHVRGIDDANIEGNHFSLITHRVTASGDALNYPLSLAGATVAAELIDDDGLFVPSGNGQLVGVDFDQTSGNSTPMHWTRIEPSFSSDRSFYENLIDETGTRSGIDLFVHTVTGSGGSTPNTSTLPQHGQSLQAIDGVLFSGEFQNYIEPVGFTWAGLTPGRQYEIYVFGLENFVGTFRQQVTISGAGQTIVMDQTLSNRTVWINDEAGSSSRSLESYAKFVTADEFGTIDIRVAPLSGSEGIVIPALAIQEVLPVATVDALQSDSFAINEGNGSNQSIQFTLSRSGDLTSAATVDFSVTGSGGNPVDAADFIGGLPGGSINFAAGDATSETITMTVAADVELEGDERYSIDLSNPSAGLLLATAKATGVIQNDDQSGPMVSLSVSPSLIAEDGNESMVFTVSRSATGGTLSVPFTVSGSATFGDDYTQTGAESFTASGGNVSFAEGVETVEVTITPLVDALFEPNETIVLGITSGDGFNAQAEATGVIRRSAKQTRIGLYQGDVSLFHLKDTFSPGPSDQYFSFGPGGDAGWIPLAGDWDGDGTDTIGLFQPDLSLFHLKNSFTAGPSDQYFFFGPQNAGWTPIAGDWDGDGVDTIGLYQPDNSFFHLKNSFTPGNADHFFGFGPGGAGWIPLAGDWNGDGIDTIGLYQPDASLFHLRDAFGSGPADQFFAFGPAGAGWIPMAGDWNGDGIDTIGLYQTDISLFHLRDSFGSGAADQFFAFGPSGDAGWQPLAGDWNGPPSGSPRSNEGRGESGNSHMDRLQGTLGSKLNVNGNRLLSSDGSLLGEADG